ncbi:RDD family protein [Thiocystis minor]|uniref:RDD family protein n=1 Tax=Thiocystis minor TaxID=61597 RepID=UPI00191436EF|nr:RDD family protein [Thiocystis minor]MBK5963584.1 RDD family protein [Thiocystis minor]
MEFDVTLAKQPSLFRRLGAMFYDSVLLLGILMLATAIVAIPYEIVAGAKVYEATLPLALMRLYLLVVIAAFYVYFWMRGGQTLGMRAWRFRVIGDDGANLGFGSALQRFGWAILSLLPAGLGFWWSLIDRDRLTWHDRKSHSRLVMLEKNAGKAS